MDGSLDGTHQEIDKMKYDFEIKYIKQNHIGRATQEMWEQQFPKEM